jgi:hypothetical protein
MVPYGDYCEMKEGDFSAMHRDSFDEVSDEESQASDKLLCTSKTTKQERSVFTMKAINQWALQGMVIQFGLLHCASSVANDLQIQQ